jgi:hypothetical protein
VEKFVEQQLARVCAVVDANIVNGELRWRLGSRVKPGARSSLEESLDSGLLVLVAPNQLKAEIAEHLPDIAADAGVTLAEAEEQWRQFQPKLRFYEPLVDGRKTNRVTDPNDLPYKRTSEELGLPIYTRDSHLSAMGASVIWTCIDTALRDHARSRSVTLGFTLGSTYSVAVAVGAIESAVKLVKKAIKGFVGLPEWLQIIVAGTVAVIVIHPKSRSKLVQLWRSFAGLPDGLKEIMLEGLIELIEQFSGEEDSAKATKRKIEKALPKSPKLSAIVHARRILLLENAALSLREIAKTMKAQGYSAKSKNFETYLRRILRESSQFYELRRDVWELVCIG